MREGTRFGRRSTRITALAAAAALAAGVVACGSDSSSGGGGSSSAKKEVTIGLITKTETNPFFVKMKEGAQAQAKKDSVKLLTASGKSDTDNASQVTAIENMTTQGAKGILITSERHEGHRPVDQEGARRGRAGHRARHADRAADGRRRAVRHRQPEGRRADRPVREGEGAAMGITPKIAMLDLAPGITVGVLRHNGFLKGFGIKDGDPQIVRRQDTQGDQAKGQAAMENSAPERPGHQPGLYDQRAGRHGRQYRAQGGGQEKDDRSSPSTAAARRQRGSRPA